MTAGHDTPTPDEALASIRFHISQAAHLPAFDRAIIDALCRAPYRDPKLLEDISARRADPEFMERLRQTTEESQAVLDALGPDATGAEVARLRAGLQRIYDSPLCSDYHPHRHHKIVGEIMGEELRRG